MWKIEKIISKGDYNYCKTIPIHPYANENGYVLEHRVIMENHLGRLLNSNEIVHHKDHNKKRTQGITLEMEKAISENVIKQFRFYENSEQTI